MHFLEILFENKADFIAKGPMAAPLVKAAQRDSFFTKNHETITASDVVQALASMDPTPQQKSLVWLARAYKDGQFRMEDAHRTRDELQQFYNNLTKIKAAGESTDLMTYKTRDALLDVVDSAARDDEVVSNRQVRRDTKLQGADRVIEGNGLTVIRPKTEEAACIYGAGTKWCTAAKEDNMFEEYAGVGDLYILMLNGRKWQLHVESGSFMNERDTPISSDDIRLLSENPTYTKFLNMLIKKHYGAALSKAGVKI